MLDLTTAGTDALWVITNSVSYFSRPMSRAQLEEFFIFTDVQWERYESIQR